MPQVLLMTDGSVTRGGFSINYNLLYQQHDPCDHPHVIALDDQGVSV